MKMLLAGLLAASTLGLAAPASAAGIYVGPGGVGVDTGVRPYRDYDRRDEYRGGRYEGRSVSRDGERGGRFRDRNNDRY